MSSPQIMQCLAALFILATVALVAAVTFDPSLQLVSTTGIHKFVAPGPDDARGPCPALNAMANHGYLPHNGVGTISQFIDSCLKVFGLDPSISGNLAYYGGAFTGNGPSFSIGGPSKAASIISVIPGQVVGNPNGLSYSHNKYEGDASPSRCDQYLCGESYKLHTDLFQKLLNAGSPTDYTFDQIIAYRDQRLTESKMENPYFCFPPFGLVAGQGAYFFISRLMPNHTAAHPEGILNSDILKTFFSVKGSGQNMTYTEGYERIPDNWYRRSDTDLYNLPKFAMDAFVSALRYPQFIQLGCNTGKNNSFAGIDLGNFTGGVYNTQKLFSFGTFLCFIFNFAILASPDLLEPFFGTLAKDIYILLSYVVGYSLSGLNCPAVGFYNRTQFYQFPGYSKLNSTGGYS